MTFYPIIRYNLHTILCYIAPIISNIALFVFIMISEVTFKILYMYRYIYIYIYFTIIITTNLYIYILHVHFPYTYFMYIIVCQRSKRFDLAYRNQNKYLLVHVRYRIRIHYISPIRQFPSI